MGLLSVGLGFRACVCGAPLFSSLSLGSRRVTCQQRVGLQETGCALKPSLDSIRTEQISYALQKRRILYRLEFDSSNDIFLCSGGGGAARVSFLSSFFYASHPAVRSQCNRSVLRRAGVHRSSLKDPVAIIAISGLAHE